MKLQKNKSVRGYFFSIIIILMSLNFSTYAAEYVYISDNLRVGVRTEPMSGVPPIGVVFTGMRLEVQDRKEGYVKIATDKGISGWIKDIYVTKKAPAIIELNAFKAKYDNLKKELSKSQETTALLEKANLALSEKIDELKAEQRDWSRERASLMASQYKDSSWLWIIELVVLVVVSFAAGAFWYRTQAMKKLGGLRV